LGKQWAVSFYNREDLAVVSYWPAEIDILLQKNQRQHRTLQIQKDVLHYALC